LIEVFMNQLAPNPDYRHLGRKALQVIELSPEERIAFIQDSHWVGYSRAKEILNDFEDLLAHPRMHRMPCRLLLGATNNGKTVLLKRFAKLHPAFENPDQQGITAAVLWVQAPPVPDESRLYEAILRAVSAPFRHADSLPKREALVMSNLRNVGLKVLLIDEIHHLISGSTNRHRQMLNVIKGLGNSLQISIVAAGTKEAFSAMKVDPQMENRFIPVALPRWEMGDEYLRLLASFEQLLPLKRPSNLAGDQALAMKVFSLIGGKIGELWSLLGKVATVAIQTGHERIDAKLIDRSGWESPGERGDKLRNVD
jgi:type II secretory pathway predicted ATPase ExeA